jgi:hypothetical protein
MTAVLLVVVIGAVLMALAVDLGALVGWLQRRLRRRPGRSQSIAAAISRRWGDLK